MGTVIRIMNADYSSAGLGKIENIKIEIPDSIITLGGIINSSNNQANTQGYVAMGAYTSAVTIPTGVTGIGGIVNAGANISSGNLLSGYLPFVFLDASDNIKTSQLSGSNPGGALMGEVSPAFVGDTYKAVLFSAAIPIPTGATKVRFVWYRPMINGDGIDYRRIGLHKPELMWIKE